MNGMKKVWLTYETLVHPEDEDGEIQIYCGYIMPNYWHEKFTHEYEDMTNKWGEEARKIKELAFIDLAFYLDPVEVMIENIDHYGCYFQEGNAFFSESTIINYSNLTEKCYTLHIDDMEWTPRELEQLSDYCKSMR